MIAHLQEGALGDARILKPETAQRHARARLQPAPRRGRVRPRLLRDVHERPPDHRARRRHELLPQRARAARRGEGVGFFVSVNNAAARPRSCRGTSLRAFMNHYFPARLPAVNPPADFDTRAAKYAGSYVFSRHSFTKNEKLFGILTSLKVAPTDHDTLLVALPGEAVPGEFVEVAPHTFRRRDSGDTSRSLPTRTARSPTSSAGRSRSWRHTRWPGTSASSSRVDRRARHPVLGGSDPGRAALVEGGPSGTVNRAPRATARRGHRSRHSGVRGVAGSHRRQQHRRSDDGFPAVFKVALAAPLIAIPLTLGVLYLAISVWRERLWTRYGRVRYSVIALVFVAFLPGAPGGEPDRLPLWLGSRGPKDRPAMTVDLLRHFAARQDQLLSSARALVERESPTRDAKAAAELIAELAAGSRPRAARSVWSRPRTARTCWRGSTATHRARPGR